MRALIPFAYQGKPAPYSTEDGVLVTRARSKTGLAAARRVMLVHYVEDLAAVISDSRSTFGTRWACGSGSSDAVLIADADAYGGVCVRCAGTTLRGPVVYRYFDESGQLLYVGSTVDYAAREFRHSRRSQWWGEVASTRRESYSSAMAARAAEALAIRTEDPAHNKHLRKRGQALPVGGAA